MNGKGPTKITEIPGAARGILNRRTLFYPSNYMRTDSGMVVSKYFKNPIQSPLNPRVTVPPLVEAYSVDDIQVGADPVECEMDELFYGIKNNLYFPEYKLYVINTDNLTFYALAEATKRGEIELGASLFTLDAHDDILSPAKASILIPGQFVSFWPRPWEIGTLKDYADYAINISPLEQLQAATKLGLIKEEEIHLIAPIPTGPDHIEPLCLPGSSRSVGTRYLYPSFPLKHFNSLPTKKVVSHVDIDFHSENFEKSLKRMMENPNGTSLNSLFSAVTAEPEKVAPEKVEEFERWVKETGFFRKAGIRIICVSPNIVYPEDVVWLTRKHVKLVMEEASASS